MNDLEEQNAKELFEDIQKMFYEYEATENEKISALFNLLLDELIEVNFNEDEVDISSLMFWFSRCYRDCIDIVRKYKND